MKIVSRWPRCIHPKSAQSVCQSLCQALCMAVFYFFRNVILQILFEVVLLEFLFNPKRILTATALGKVRRVLSKQRLRSVRTFFFIGKTQFATAIQKKQNFKIQVESKIENGRKQISEFGVKCSWRGRRKMLSEFFVIVLFIYFENSAF